MHLRKIGILVLCILASTIVHAQFGYGFRAGLSYSKLLGERELDNAGNALDSYRFASGFHIGVSLNYRVTDLFGFRSELIFTQRGTQYKYDGDSYYFLARRTANERIVSGHRLMDYNISMATFELPLIAYYKIGSFEVSAGINNAFILSSTGGGTLTFNGVAPSGNTIDQFRVILEYNFNRDGAQEAGVPSLPVRIDGTTLLIPGSVGAYYDFEQKDGNRYKVYDIGLTGGLAFYLNDGLYLGARATYGLIDADDDKYTISLHRVSPAGHIFRESFTRHFTINASLGFLF